MANQTNIRTQHCLQAGIELKHDQLPMSILYKSSNLTIALRYDLDHNQANMKYAESFSDQVLTLLSTGPPHAVAL